MKTILKTLLILTFSIVTMVSCKNKEEDPTPNAKDNTEITTEVSGDCDAISQSNDRNLFLVDSLYCDNQASAEFISVLINGEIVSTCECSGGNSFIEGISKTKCNFIKLCHPQFDTDITDLKVNYDYDLVEPSSTSEDDCIGTMEIEYEYNNTFYTSKSMNDLDNYYNNIKSVTYVGEDSGYKVYLVKGYVKTKIYDTNSQSIDFEGEYSVNIKLE